MDFVDMLLEALPAILVIFVVGLFLWGFVVFMNKVEAACKAAEVLEMSKTFTVKTIDGTELKGLKKVSAGNNYKFATTNGEVIIYENIKSILFIKEEAVVEQK